LKGSYFFITIKVGSHINDNIIRLSKLVNMTRQEYIKDLIYKAIEDDTNVSLFSTLDIQTQTKD